MPTTLPPCSTGPPLLPLLMAASICRVSSEQRPCEYCRGEGGEGSQWWSTGRWQVMMAAETEVAAVDRQYSGCHQLGLAASGQC